MLKHSINHYGSLGAPLQSPHPLTSSSHSGDTSLHHAFVRKHQQVNDPTRFIEGPPPPHNHSHSHSYLDQSYPSIHNSRLFLDSSRISRKPPDDLSNSKHMNGSIYFSPPRDIPTNLNATVAGPPLSDCTINPNTSNNPNNPDGSSVSSSKTISAVYRHGVLRTLSLLSVLSLLLALNSLIFLLKNVWTPGDGIRVSSSGDLGLLYEVTLCLTAMSLSINLCVLLVCSAQYFFAATGSMGSTSFLEKVTLTRGVAIGGFFFSIPLFLCSIVLYTFTYLSFSPPTLIIGGTTAAAVMAVIFFGGCAMVHHVFIWQKEKTKKHAFQVSENPTVELSTLV